MLYMVKEGHLDTARDIVLVMLVNKCASDHHSMRSDISQGCMHPPSVHHQAALRKVAGKVLAGGKSVHPLPLHLTAGPIL